MEYKVKISESAEHDLDGILSYIAGKLANPKAAADFADALEEHYGQLETYPLAYELSRNERLARKGYRRFAVGSYVVLYLADETKREINIARKPLVLHSDRGSRDPRSSNGGSPMPGTD